MGWEEHIYEMESPLYVIPICPMQILTQKIPAPLGEIPSMARE